MNTGSGFGDLEADALLLQLKVLRAEYSKHLNAALFAKEVRLRTTDPADQRPLVWDLMAEAGEAWSRKAEELQESVHETEKLLFGSPQTPLFCDRVDLEC
jgi:hypothetical protein